MKKFLKVIALFLLIVVVFPLLILGIDSIFGGYNYKTDIDCVNSRVGYGFQVKTVLYKYENEDKEILLYEPNNGTFFNCVLGKKSKNGEDLYRFEKGSNTPPITWFKEWVEVDKNLQYIFVDFQDDIEDIDCMGYEPEGAKIYYKIATGEEESCWIYVIDKTKSEK